MGKSTATAQIHACKTGLTETTTLVDFLALEGRAAQVYWDLLVETPLPWRPRALKRIPAHWAAISPRTDGKRERVRDATDPWNAILNYCYTLLEVETRVACEAVGLDPDLGLIHVDDRLRESFIYDLLEPLLAKAMYGRWMSRLDPHNRAKSYDHRIKPYGFVQSITPAVIGSNEPLPIAPFERDLAKSKRLQLVDYHTGDPIRLDWSGSSMAHTVPVMRLSEYVQEYGRHPEAKAADWKSNPAGPDTIGLLHRLPLQSKRLIRIGKEVDRLGGDEGATLEPDRPVEYECDELAESIDYLAQFPQAATVRDLALTERGWRKIIKGVVEPLATTAERIQELAEQRRIEEP
ncbi:MAG TPA: CRISPR-associated endonuclease Cas1 [Candidatus Binatia bacterium]|nr:CRISPR-associated endonuclease Cas1 [Candidatus Binatia bacterium]